MPRTKAYRYLSPVFRSPARRPCAHHKSRSVTLASRTTPPDSHRIRMPELDTEYTPLTQGDDVEKELDAVPPSLDSYRKYRPASSLSIWTVLLVVLIIGVNIACMATTWSRVDQVYDSLHSRLDFRETRELWRPNTDSYYGD